MKSVKIYIERKNIIAGMTLKRDDRLERNNMALHVTKNEEHLIENRKRLAETLKVPLNHFVCANQTHSANFYEVTGEDKGRRALGQGSAMPNTDALYTKEAKIGRAHV